MSTEAMPFTYTYDYTEVLDESGTATGEVAELLEVHKSGAWHKAVHVWIVNLRGEILLQKRSEWMHLFPGAWDLSVGAHVSKGEMPLETAIRETKEELGIDVPESEFEYLFLEKNQDDGLPNSLLNNEFNDVYLVRLKEDTPTFHLEKKEVTEIKFFTLGEFEKMIGMERSYFAPPRVECRKILALLRSQLEPSA